MSDEEKLIHRDDMDYEDVAAIEAQFSELFPGMKVVFAGDNPAGLPPEIAEQMAALRLKMDHDLFHGLCRDCGAVMPNFTDVGREDWSLADGWRWFSDQATGEIAQWQCPECDAKENAT
jgi:hypothetical protein